MTTPDPTTQFVTNVTEVQRDLYAYISALLAGSSDADEVLQETNTVLWNKRSEFQAGTEFRAWAYRVAHFEVLAFRKRQARDRHRFDDRLVEQMAGECTKRAEAFESQRRALASCREKLAERDRDLLDMRYSDAMRAPQIADKLGRSRLAIRQALFRIRSNLRRCIQRILSSEGEA